MPRLNKHAFGILAVEVNRCAGKDALSKIEQDIVLKDLEKLRSEQGSPASAEEMRRIVISTYPKFSEKSLTAAAKANRRAGVWGKIKLVVVLLVGAVVGLAVLGTLHPSPQTAEKAEKKTVAPPTNREPRLPNPSKLSTDENYRQALALIEQADRLINQATGPADLVLGEEKLNQAKKHLAELPVYYYTSQPYISRKGDVRYRSQKVYEDRFASLRSELEQMQAKLFQEKQAQAQMEQAEQAINASKQQYQQAQTITDRSAVIASWKTNVERLQQISQETLAGKTASSKLSTYQRDFIQFSTMEAAKQFALEAAKLGQNPPHPAENWQKIENQWQEAINRLEQITEQDPAYIEAQKLLANYKTNLGIVQTRRQVEETSTIALKGAKEQIASLLASGSSDPFSAYKDRTISQLQQIINQLQQVKPGTTAYAEAQQLMRSAQNKLNELKPPLPATNF